MNLILDTFLLVRHLRKSRMWFPWPLDTILFFPSTLTAYISKTIENFSNFLRDIPYFNLIRRGKKMNITFYFMSFSSQSPFYLLAILQSIRELVINWERRRKIRSLGDSREKQEVWNICKINPYWTILNICCCFLCTSQSLTKLISEI